MIQYHMARMPNYGSLESPQYAAAEDLKSKIKGFETKAKTRWELTH
jgi:hypothetical protein